MPTIEEHARDMLNGAAIDMKHPARWSRNNRYNSPSIEALCRALEALCRALEAHDATIAEFEAFKRKVSDEIERCSLGDFVKERLSRFIIPKPVDPLVEAVKDCGYAKLDAIEPEFAADLRAALAKRGGSIVFKEAGK